MRIEIDPASAQAFMATPLNVERNGMPLMMGSALLALDIDPWSLAGELAMASRRDAVMRLEGLLRKIREGVPEAETIARQAIAALPPPLVEGAGLITVMRQASRDPDLVDALLCAFSVSALAILLLVSMMTRSLWPAVSGYSLIALTWLVLSARHDKVLRMLLVGASGIIALIFGALSASI
jgi:hypothetical protein